MLHLLHLPQRMRSVIAAIISLYQTVHWLHALLLHCQERILKAIFILGRNWKSMAFIDIDFSALCSMFTRQYQTLH